MNNELLDCERKHQNTTSETQMLYQTYHKCDVNCYRDFVIRVHVHEVYILASVGFAEAHPTDVQTSSKGRFHVRSKVTG